MYKNKEFIQKLQQFLKDEEEIFGPLMFSPLPSESHQNPDVHNEPADRMESHHSSRLPVSPLPETDKEATDQTNKVSSDAYHETADRVVTDKDSETRRSADPAPDKKDDKIFEQESETTQPGPLNDLTTQLERYATLDELKQYCASLTVLRTDLQGTNLVFGVGNPDADLMIVGEAPGEKEDKQGEPFVGAAGQLLNKILAAIRFRREDVYIANILKHRPPGNRTPSHHEMQKSLPVLLRQIDLIKPKVILCVGKVSGTTLLGKDASLRSMRGRFYPFKNAHLTVTYHPAALLRNPQWKRPVWEDVKKVRQKYDELGGRP